MLHEDQHLVWSFKLLSTWVLSSAQYICLQLNIFTKNCIWGLIYFAKHWAILKFIIDAILCVNQRWAVRKSVPQIANPQICGPSANVTICGFADPIIFCGLPQIRKYMAGGPVRHPCAGVDFIPQSGIYEFAIRLLYLKRWEVEPTFAERDRKHTMIDLRGISTNWFKNQLCPFIRLSRLRTWADPIWDGTPWTGYFKCREVKNWILPK